MGKFLLLLTNLVFPFAALWVLLGFVFSPRRRVLKTLKQELKERFALEDGKDLPQGALWIHCASVGEVKSIGGLVKHLKTLYQRPILLTVSTAAGKAEAQKNADITQAVLAPLDFYPFVRRFITRSNPHRLFVIEREIWPNMLYGTQQAGVPVMLVNSRISDKSARAYRWIKPLFKLLFKPIALGAMQDEHAALRYGALGMPQERIRVCGNIKYDTLKETPTQLPQVQSLIEQLGWQGAPILVCGSTHPIEEATILAALPAWAKQGIKVIFAPRHLERKEEIHAALRKQPLAFGFLSEQSFPNSCSVVCADTMGILQSLYACATLTFVGGSIAPRGAHNLLEPAILGKTVLFGHHFYNTPDVAQALLACGGGVLVDENNLQETVLRLIKNPAALENMATKAKAAALDFKGATQKIVEAIKNYERK